MEKGLIHVYHGDGKGKTTASVGLAIRAAGNGEKVMFVQFMKDGSSGEIEVLKGIKGVTYKCAEGPVAFYSTLKGSEKEQFDNSQRALFRCVEEKIAEFGRGQGGLIVLDEATYVMNYGIISVNDFETLLKNKPQNVEIVITGRNPDATILAISDYVSEMKCEKHPFSNGIPARKGIEY